MGWESSDRRSRLPRNWDSTRNSVLSRDGNRCTWGDRIEGHFVRCPNPATDVDHIKPGDDHSLANLRSLCSYHHNRKSSAEGHAASAAKRREIRSKFRRAPEKHPGLL